MRGGTQNLLRLISPLPLGVKRRMPELLALTGNRFVDTAVVSNLGRPKELASFFGDHPGEFYFTPPYWSVAAISVGAITARQHSVSRPAASPQHIGPSSRKSVGGPARCHAHPALAERTGFHGAKAPQVRAKPRAIGRSFGEVARALLAFIADAADDNDAASSAQPQDLTPAFCSTRTFGAVMTALTTKERRQRQLNNGNGPSPCD